MPVAIAPAPPTLVDRSVTLAGRAFVSIFPLVIVVAATVVERTRSWTLSAVTARLDIVGDADAQEAHI